MSCNAPIVYVVDEDASVRKPVADLILGAGLRSQCFASAAEFLAQRRDAVPSCLVLDVNLRVLDGLELQALVADERNKMPVIFFTGCRDIGTTVRAMKAGAFEYLTKSIDGHRLLSVVQKALDISVATLNREAQLNELRARLCTLTRREFEVLTLVVSGQLNKQVGGKLGISEITVKAHRGNVMRKMQAASFAHLINMAARLRLAAPTRTDISVDFTERQPNGPTEERIDDVLQDTWPIFNRPPSARRWTAEPKTVR
jgi:FixJ family two-component response regulator